MSRSITVNAVARVFARTATTDQVAPASRQRILPSVPMGQMIEPEAAATRPTWAPGPAAGAACTVEDSVGHRSLL